MVLNGTSQKSNTYKSKENYSACWYVNKALTTRGVACLERERKIKNNPDNLKYSSAVSTHTFVYDTTVKNYSYQRDARGENIDYKILSE